MDRLRSNDFDSLAIEDSDDSLVDQIDIQQYLRVLRKYKWPITLFTALVTAMAAYYAYTATPIYRSTSTLLIEFQQPTVVAYEGFVGAEKENYEYYQTQYELLRSRELALRVVDFLNLKNHPDFQVTYSSAPVESRLSAIADDSNVFGSNQKDLPAIDDDGQNGSTSYLFNVVDSLKSFIGIETDEDMVQHSVQEVGQAASRNLLSSQLNTDVTFAGSSVIALGELEEDTEKNMIAMRLLGNLSINPIRNTKLVKISYDSPDPVMAATIANSFAQQYITSYLETRMQMRSQAQSWLNDQLVKLKTNVDAAKQRVTDFKIQHGLVDGGDGVGSFNNQELVILTTEMAQARTALLEARSLRNEAQSLKSTSPSLLETLPVVQADALVRSIKLEQGIAQRELDELSTRYGAKHPKIIDVRSRLESQTKELNRHIDRILNAIESDYQLARQRVNGIQAKLNAGKSENQDIGIRKLELDELEREVNKHQEVYDLHYARKTEANAVEGLDTANARIQDYALPSNGPIKPRKQLIIALAVLASLIMSALMAFLYEQSDDTIKGTGDIENKVGIKMLGIIPLLKGGILGTKRKLPLNPEDIEDKKGTFVEAINTARTALTLDDDENLKKIILVTSSIPGEGKSTTSVNLAYSLSQMEKVLLIDCDMRKPTIAKTLQMDRNVPGLSSLIMRTAEPKQCIHRNAIGDMDIIPSGPIPDQPLELLSSKRFEKLIEQLSQYYDRIVIDSAPVQAVSDALVLSRLADTVIYAIKSHSTSIDLVKRGIQRLRQSQASIGGAIITQVDVDKIVSYGGDYYYQGYYDYYGYNTKGERSRKGSRKKLTQEEINAIRNDDEDYDYDFGIGGSTAAGAVGSKVIGRRKLTESANINPEFARDDLRGQGSNGNGRLLGDHQDNFSENLSEMEFDLTTRLESSRSRKRKTLRDNLEDDLDLI